MRGCAGSVIVQTALQHPPKPKENPNMKSLPTFRDAVREQAARLWRLQWAELAVVLGAIGVGFWFEWVRLAGFVAFVALLYLFVRGCRRVKCPGCGHCLAYLLEDKQATGPMAGTSTAGIPRGAISRNGLPETLHACPYCGHPFDAVQEEKAAPS